MTGRQIQVHAEAHVEIQSLWTDQQQVQSLRAIHPSKEAVQLNSYADSVRKCKDTNIYLDVSGPPT